MIVRGRISLIQFNMSLSLQFCQIDLHKALMTRNIALLQINTSNTVTSLAERSEHHKLHFLSAVAQFLCGFSLFFNETNMTAIANFLPGERHFARL